MIPGAGGKNRRGGRAVTWRVFFTCWLVYTVFWTPYIVREHFPALALVERGTMNVERYLGWIDDIFSGSKGGAYINNNPGASLTAAVPLLLMRPVLARLDQWNQRLPRIPGQGDDEELFRLTMAEGRGFYFLAVAFVTVALVMAPATAATAAYMCARVTQADVPAAGAAAIALLYGLGTPVLFRAEHLNHNLLVGDAGIMALLLLWDPGDRPLQPARAAAAGLLGGYAVLCDYSGVVVIAVTALYVWLRSVGLAAAPRWTRRTNWRVVAAYVAGVVPGVAALAIYQAWAFGSPYLPSQRYMVPTAPTSHGYHGFDWPSPALVWANFFDPRFGLFAYCPALILALAAPFVTRVRYRVANREKAILLIYFALAVLFCAANQYSWLQPATGFRYLVIVVPALALLAVEAAQALPRVVRWTIAGASCAESLILAATYQKDVRLAAGTLWQRRFALPWMIRLGEAGVPVNWAWTLVTFVLLALAIAFVWRAGGARADAALLEAVASPDPSAGVR